MGSYILNSYQVGNEVVLILQLFLLRPVYRAAYIIIYIETEYISHSHQFPHLSFKSHCGRHSRSRTSNLYLIRSCSSRVLIHKNLVEGIDVNRVNLGLVAKSLPRVLVLIRDLYSDLLFLGQSREITMSKGGGIK